MEFHLSRKSRDFFNFDQSIFTLRGDVIFPNYHAAQLFAHKINENPDNPIIQSKKIIQASEIFTMGLLDEIYHLAIHEYERKTNPDAITKSFKHLNGYFNPETVEDLILAFNEEFPAIPVYRGDENLFDYLKRREGKRLNTVNSLEEIIVLWLENQNPSFEPFSGFFDDVQLSKTSVYEDANVAIYDYFETQPKYGSKELNLIDFLLEPSRLYPNSLRDQLAYIQANWGEIIQTISGRLLRTLDIIHEEEKVHFFGPGEVQLPDYSIGTTFVDNGTEIEEETIKFANDREWMAELVLIAKNAYVWLDQLSKQEGRPIKKLDEIPDHELDRLRAIGVTGLWLIGMWERSTASERIKRLCGNPEALASAYSLFSYEIAKGLGGDAAYANLRERANARGIRLGSDMVPNHMGIDSPWVINHPEWFVQLPYSPYPSYRFNGIDLCDDPRVTIQLEDHYYDRTDASVVFKYRDNETGEERFIYHGNDGTSMPWNDTAQLNYLNPAVREAVIQTIVEVAKKFPIIRFDAAMTLTKKHYQRLWYPEPGSGGDIPSRAEFGMTKAEFGEVMAEEFWRDVVARIESEAPDTLLLAEAFWMMEGYFVRSLGMHRVYNSAFMNLLRDEDNRKYRGLIKETLAFEPQILQRYVNFMNNPDERTAVDQYGKGDKYFGICTLMATFPGLPMFGHGQIEGYAEKYGMEYMKAYWEEQPDSHLFERHQRQIFPLLHRRRVFSSVENFRMYDFIEEYAGVNEDVFAYSNLRENDKALVVYHNRFRETSGRIMESVGFADKLPGEKTQEVIQESICKGLKVEPAKGKYLIFKDLVSGHQYIRSTEDLDENGLFLHLNAYECHVFIDFYEVWDSPDNEYGYLCDLLNGEGVPNIIDALDDLVLQPVKAPFRDLFTPEFLTVALTHCQSDKKSEERTAFYNEATWKLGKLLDGIQNYVGESNHREAIIEGSMESLKSIIEFRSGFSEFDFPGMVSFKKAYKFIMKGLEQDSSRNLVLISWAILRYLGKSVNEADFEVISKIWIDEWQYADIMAKTFAALGISEDQSNEMIAAVRMLVNIQCWYPRYEKLSVRRIGEIWFANPDIQNYLGVNEYNGEIWFNNERFIEFEWWLVVIAAIQGCSDHPNQTTYFVENTLGAYEVYQQIQEARLMSDYKVNQLLGQIPGSD